MASLQSRARSLSPIASKHLHGRKQGRPRPLHDPLLSLLCQNPFAWRQYTTISAGRARRNIWHQARRVCGGRYCCSYATIFNRSRFNEYLCRRNGAHNAMPAWLPPARNRENQPDMADRLRDRDAGSPAGADLPGHNAASLPPTKKRLLRSLARKENFACRLGRLSVSQSSSDAIL